MIKLDFSKLDGLVPAVAQDWETGEVLMVAFMNKESWDLTLKTGIMHYWSRSRGKLWKKGESSGNVQEVKELRVGCENDSVLAKIRQVGGAACHTGYRSCFHGVVEKGGDKSAFGGVDKSAFGGVLRTDGVPVFDPAKIYGEKK